MTQPSGSRSLALKELLMRFAPAAAALSLCLAMTASISIAGTSGTPDPRAATLIAQGEAALAAGETEAAIDAFEAALAVDPGYTPIFIDLAEASRQSGLQGKAIRYYREALARDPRNFAAIAGEGAVLMEKGAVEMAKRNLAKLQSLCGDSCPETVALQGRIARGPSARLAADHLHFDQSPVPAAHVAQLVELIETNVISSKIAKEVFDHVWNGEGSPAEVVEKHGLKQVTDTGAIEKAIDEIIAANPDKAAGVAEKPQSLGWFVGQVMKATGGKANPAAVALLSYLKSEPARRVIQDHGYGL
jgi:tetratricopeptide (TPR) repeat protein